MVQDLPVLLDRLELREQKVLTVVPDLLVTLALQVPVVRLV